MRPPATYSAADIAGKLGCSVDHVYRRIDGMQARDGFPAPLLSTGRRRWDRASVDAWFSRHHPDRPKLVPANDVAPPETPASLEGWRDRLAREYGRAG